jgi:single cache domain-containing protein
MNSSRSLPKTIMLTWGQTISKWRNALDASAPAHDARSGITAGRLYINVNRWDYKDNQGQLLIQNIVGKARSGGGYLEYQVPKAAGGPELRVVALIVVPEMDRIKPNLVPRPEVNH